jgi:hypothetical protein
MSTKSARGSGLIGEVDPSRIAPLAASEGLLARLLGSAEKSHAFGMGRGV